MARHIILGSISSQYTIFESGSTWVFGAATTVYANNAGESGIYADPSRSQTHLVIDTSIHGSTIGVELRCDDSSVEVKKNGSIDGVVMQGARISLDNSGDIFIANMPGLDYCVVADGHEVKVRNSGMLVGSVNSVNLTGTDLHFTNERNGIVSAFDVGVAIQAAAGEKGWLVNNGLIKANILSISGGMGDETVVNKGTINGNVSLGDGNDTFDGRGGKFVTDPASLNPNDVRGGYGDDIYWIDSAKVPLQEFLAAGTDKVHSSVSYTLSDHFEQLLLEKHGNINGTGNSIGNLIVGNGGNNKLAGLGGMDFIIGGRGNDVMRGGAMDDKFSFETHGGKDTIADFQDGGDLIFIADLRAFTTVEDLKKHHLTDTGHDLIIRYGNDVLTLLGVDRGDIDAGDFTIV